ncbi:MAG: GNAT family N-acetyltransferase [Actinobacteria bacterium]|nr:GNAT family N-acetyltransferase [Actinomycetota bacterium]
MVHIIAPETQGCYGVAIAAAGPEMFKAFWPAVRGNYFFRNRRLFIDFMRQNEGRIYYVSGGSRTGPPFILVGNWRSRTDITALWHIKGDGIIKKRLVRVAAASSFEAGSDRFVTKPLGECEADEYERWGFEVLCRILLLEKRLRRESESSAGLEADVEIVRYRKRYLDDVLSLDASAFDDFWKLDAHTLEAVATSCYRNAFLAAKRDGEVVGYAVGGANGRFGYLQRLGIHAAHQGEGIGEALTRRIISTLQGMGAVSLMVNTQEDNDAALSLYRKMGFETMPDPRFIMQCTPRGLEQSR